MLFCLVGVASALVSPPAAHALDANASAASVASALVAPLAGASKIEEILLNTTVAATQEAPDLPAWTEPPAQPPTNGWAFLLSVLVVGLVLGIIAVGALCGTCGEGWECAHLFQKAEEEIQRQQANMRVREFEVMEEGEKVVRSLTTYYEEDVTARGDCVPFAVLAHAPKGGWSVAPRPVTREACDALRHAAGLHKETTLRYEQPAAPPHFHVHPGRAHPAVLLSPR